MSDKTDITDKKGRAMTSMDITDIAGNPVRIGTNAEIVGQYGAYYEVTDISVESDGWVEFTVIRVDEDGIRIPGESDITVGYADFRAI